MASLIPYLRSYVPRLERTQGGPPAALATALRTSIETAEGGRGHLRRELFLGHRRHLGGYRAVLTADDQAHAMYVAPQRVGKTSSAFTPMILASSRAIVATFSKAADLPTTIPHRLRVAEASGGQVYLLNLKSEPTPELPADVVHCRHDPLAGCEDPTWAQECAKTWVSLHYAGRQSGNDNSKFFQLHAVDLLRAYCHAAALGRRSVSDIVRWIGTHATDEPARIIRERSVAPAWADALSDKVRSYPGETLAGIFATAMTVVSPFSNPLVGRQLEDPTFDADRFLGEGISTLYILDPTGDSKLSPVAPILTALVERIVKRAYRRASTAPGGRWEPGLLLAADELLNITPLPSLRALALQGASQSVIVAYALHAVADLIARYGKEEAKTILGNTTNHVLFGRIGHGDREYLEDLSALVGSYDEVEVSHSRAGHWLQRQPPQRTTSRRVVQKPILPLADCQRTPDRQAILVSHLTPWLLDMPRWYEVAWSRARGWDPARQPLPTHEHADEAYREATREKDDDA